MRFQKHLAKIDKSSIFSGNYALNSPSEKKLRIPMTSSCLICGRLSKLRVQQVLAKTALSP